MDAIGLAQVLIVASGLVVLALGTLHLLYTFRGPKLHPRETATIDAMRADRLRLTGQTTVWKAWIGFNASHSLGAMLFGSLFAYLAMFQLAVVQSSGFLQGVGIVFLVGLAMLGKRYWFSIPYRGIVIALVAFVAGVVAMHA